jgi:hypothetical protein
MELSQIGMFQSLPIESCGLEAGPSWSIAFITMSYGRITALTSTKQIDFGAMRPEKLVLAETPLDYHRYLLCTLAE